MAERILSPNEAAAAFKRRVSQAACDQILARLLPGNARNYRQEALTELVCRHYPGMTPDQVRRMSAAELLPFLSKITERERVDADEPEPPPEELLVELTSQQRKILKYLWTHSVTTTRELQEQVWGPKIVEPASILRAIERLSERLLDLKYTDRLIESAGDDYVVFKTSDK